MMISTLGMTDEFLQPEPNIFIYTDYRVYLKDAYVYEKSLKKYFSFRYFARITGFGSSGYLKMVMDGQRNISPSSIGLFSKAFRHGKKQAAYFEALVLCNQAKTDQARDLYMERLSNLQPSRAMTDLDRDKYEYFTQRHYVIIREMVALPDFKDDPAWIAKNLSPPMRPKSAQHALEVLERLGLIRKENGRWVQTDVVLSTPPEVPAIEIFQYHGQMLSLAKEALVKVSEGIRDITALTIPIQPELILEIKKKIQDFRQSIIDVVNRGSQEYHEVFQINVQMFPVTRVKTKEKGEPC
jgi:uncharacterized protein (TIGR02147 family)